MVNVDKHIRHWKSGASDAFENAKETLERGRYGFALFFAHLALEKIIKAHVTKSTGDIPPRSHNLVRLLGLTSIPVSQETSDFLEEITAFSEIGRYPEFPKKDLTREESNEYMQKTIKVFEWLMDQL